MKISGLALILTFLTAVPIRAETLPEAPDPPPSSQSAIDFRLAQRELWQYQVTWTRSYIVSLFHDLEDKEIVEKKLIENQEKIGSAIKPYYGGMAGGRLAGLMREHILIATEIIKASKSADASAMKKAMDKGRDNADKMARLLNRAKNPLWDQDAMRETFYKHLDFVALQSDARIRKDWVAELQAYDDGLQHVLLLADLLAEGVVTQFPERFR